MLRLPTPIPHWYAAFVVKKRRLFTGAFEGELMSEQDHTLNSPSSLFCRCICSSMAWQYFT